MPVGGGKFELEKTWRSTGVGTQTFNAPGNFTMNYGKQNITVQGTGGVGGGGTSATYNTVPGNPATYNASTVATYNPPNYTIATYNPPTTATYSPGNQNYNPATANYTTTPGTAATYNTVPGTGTGNYNAPLGTGSYNPPTYPVATYNPPATNYNAGTQNYAGNAIYNPTTYPVASYSTLYNAPVNNYYYQSIASHSVYTTTTFTDPLYTLQMFGARYGYNGLQFLQVSIVSGWYTDSGSVTLSNGTTRYYLNRKPDNEGLKYWVDQVIAGSATIDTFILSIPDDGTTYGDYYQSVHGFRTQSLAPAVSNISEVWIGTGGGTLISGSGVLNTYPWPGQRGYTTSTNYSTDANVTPYAPWPSTNNSSSTYYAYYGAYYTPMSVTVYLYQYAQAYTVDTVTRNTQAYNPSTAYYAPATYNTVPGNVTGNYNPGTGTGTYNSPPISGYTPGNPATYNTVPGTQNYTASTQIYNPTTYPVASYNTPTYTIVGYTPGTGTGTYNPANPATYNPNVAATYNTTPGNIATYNAQTPASYNAANYPTATYNPFVAGNPSQALGVTLLGGIGGGTPVTPTGPTEINYYAYPDGATYPVTVATGGQVVIKVN